MTTSDVLIVGGGPAGSTCAWRLRDAGLDVIVADAATFPRDKVCAGWITPAVVGDLELDLEAYGLGRTCQPFSGFRVGVIGAADAVTVAYDHPVSFGIRRCEFDHYLLQRASARLALGTPITSLHRDDGFWIVNGTIRTPMLVGAGGSQCPVARMLNGVRHDTPTVVAREAEAPVGAADRAGLAIEAGVPELYFCRDLQGYGWCVRKGDYINVGLGRLDSRSLPAATARFVEFLEERQRIPRRFAWRWRGHAYAVDAAPRIRLADAGVLLAGDAAGVADRQSGEGIRQAVESGLLAADAIIAARGQFSRDRLEPYAARVRERFDGGSIPGALAQVIPDRVKTAVAARLLTIPAFVKRVVLDDWFLHRKESSCSLH